MLLTLQYRHGLALRKSFGESLGVRLPAHGFVARAIGLGLSRPIELGQLEQVSVNITEIPLRDGMDVFAGNESRQVAHALLVRGLHHGVVGAAAADHDLTFVGKPSNSLENFL
ncbi:MAG: hypothetical protein ABJA49_16510, partial [Betaproteobacteria bacterium]